MNSNLIGMIENIADSLEHGMIYLTEDRNIGACSKKAKEIFGMILTCGSGHEEGKIEEGDIVVIADNEIGDDDKLTPDDLKCINIYDENIRTGDVILAIGVYENKKIQPVYKFIHTLSAEKQISLSHRYMGLQITAGIDFSENRIEITVNGTSYTLDFIESAGHMVVIDGSFGNVKFFQYNGYGFREEEIGNLLRGKRFTAKGRDENIVKKKLQALIFF